MRFVFLLTVGLALTAPSAWAQRGSKSPSALVKEGERLYKAGKYREAAEVLKKAGSIRVKSRSAVMRSSSTEPTMPRQPTNPTFTTRTPPGRPSQTSTSRAGSRRLYHELITRP